MSILEEAGVWARAGAGWGRLGGLGARPEGLCVSMRCPQTAHLTPRRKIGYLGEGWSLESSHLANVFGALAMGPRLRLAHLET